MKDNNKGAHWVDHSKLKPLGEKEYLRENFIKDIQASLTGATIEQSHSGRKNNPCFLQEAEVENSDAHLTAGTSKIIEGDENMSISMELEKKTL